MTRTRPKLSLGIPVFNGAAYLAQLFECLRAQTFADFEAIISDNASTDGTEQICREVIALDPRFRYRRNRRNIGAAPNFNRVFEQGTGRYFKWTAHDDLLAPTYLERCVQLLEDDPSVSVAHAAIQVVNADREPLGYDPDLGIPGNEVLGKLDLNDLIPLAEQIRREREESDDAHRCLLVFARFARECGENPAPRSRACPDNRLSKKIDAIGGT